MLSLWRNVISRKNLKMTFQKAQWLREAIMQEKCSFFNIVQTGGGVVKPVFKNYVGNCRVFWRSFNNMKFAWKGTFEALMVKLGGEIGTLLLPFLMLKKRVLKNTPCKIGQMFKRKGGGGQRHFEQC